jgi:hypothetical protein
MKVFCGSQHIRKREPNRLVSSADDSDGRKKFEEVDTRRSGYASAEAERSGRMDREVCRYG